MEGRVPGDTTIYPYADAGIVELQEIVMGVHWDPLEEDLTAAPENLDAYCLLLDQGGRLLEVIHPARPRNANGSVVHTGDSRSGASAWDDERIFVFLKALPVDVSRIAMAVVSASGGFFSDIRGASCHVSDRASEHRWVQIELTTLGQRKAHCVAVLHRESAGWKISTDAQTSGILTEPELLLIAASIRKQI